SATDSDVPVGNMTNSLCEDAHARSSVFGSTRGAASYVIIVRGSGPAFRKRAPLSPNRDDAHRGVEAKSTPVRVPSMHRTMPRNPDLAGLSARAFLRRHWQKQPLLARGAVPGYERLVTREMLFELAGRDDVESR